VATSNRGLRLTVLLLPFLLTWPLGWATMEGHLNFGGGEKDVFLLIPWLLWSIIHAIIGAVFWKRGRELWQSTWMSAALAAGIAILLVLGLAFGIDALK
jgi:hypothetical protein